jgi:hypothetical protein
VDFLVNPDDLEQKVAREIVIRMADKRVLNSFECCDNCIDQALASLQEIRKLLLDKQVELHNVVNGPLYLLIELQLAALRQFLTFVQRLEQQDESLGVIVPTPGVFQKPIGRREKYFAALEMLRAHLHRCLMQTAKIAGIEIPNIADHMRYDEAWQLEAYERPAFQTAGDAMSAEETRSKPNVRDRGKGGR